MKVLVISGFLGAGKTTFIKTMAKQTGREFAILENEYGSTGIDGDILRNETLPEKVNIWELAEGCICCSMKGDFASAVLTIANTVDPDYLVIEPTGVAMLGEVIRNLQQIEYERITLLAPVTIVDGRSYRRYSREYPEIYRNQISSAHTVFVSKMEEASAEEKNWLREELEKVNPDAGIISEHYSALDSKAWLSLLERRWNGERLEPASDDDRELPDTFSMRGAAMEYPERMFVFLELLIRGKFGNIFRAKGKIRAGKQSFRFDVADGKYSVTGQEQEGEEKVVFIGTEILRQEIRRWFLTQHGRIQHPGAGRQGLVSRGSGDPVRVKRMPLGYRSVE